MNKKDLTKQLLENVAAKFNEHIISEDEPPIPTGDAAKKVNKDKLSVEIKETAEDLLQEGDEQFFLAKDFEILTLLGVDLKKCGLIMTPDQDTANDKDEVEKDNEEKNKKNKKNKKKEVKPDQKKSTKEVKNKPKTIAEQTKDVDQDDNDDQDDKKGSKKKKTAKKKKTNTKPMGIGKFIKDGVQNDKFGDKTNVEIAELVRETFPGSVTSAAHIGTYKYRIAKGIM